MSGAVTYKCPNCGGGLIFDPEKQKYACEYCLSEFGEEDLQKPNKPEGEEPVLYTCPSCGAEIVTDKTTAADFCYYCHNPVILSGRLAGEYHPDYVIPFSIDREKAVEIFNGWIGKKKFLRKEFYSPEQIQKISGVYFPYLFYSCRTEGSLDATAEQIRVWVSGDRKYTETKTYAVRREGTMDIHYVPRNALKKANRELAEGVLPFQTGDLKPFSMGYLSGFQAERRDMNQEDFKNEVQEEIRQFAEDSLRNSIKSYNTVRVKNRQIDLADEKWEYALLPVWTLTYQDEAKNEIYYFTVNGQTGKVCGKLPVDKNKLRLLFAMVFFPVLFVMLIVGYLI